MIINIVKYMSIDDILPHLSYYYDKNSIKVIKELNKDKASYLSYLPKDMIYITKYYIIEMRIENIISTSIVKLVNSHNNNYEATVFVPIVSNYLKIHRAYSIKRLLSNFLIFPREQSKKFMYKLYSNETIIYSVIERHI